jgi:chromate transporter
VEAPSFGEAARVWARVAALSFGGPAGQIAVMHRILVDEKAWVDEERFLNALNFCMLLPGPEAQQLATYVGWLLHGTRGGLLAGGLFILPGFVSILALSLIYAQAREQLVVEALFFGLKAAVLAVVVEAALRLGKRALQTGWRRGIAAASFAALFLFDVPFPAIIAVAALVGAATGGVGAAPAAGARPSLRVATTTALTWGAVWWAPVLLVLALLGPEHVLSELALFFSGAAMVTFGGAYSVLAYVAQQAVEVHGWLQPGEMLDGLGMAETTPGPLVQVVQFVGFMGAYREPGSLPPWLAGTIASVLVTWVTFAPSFLWVFTGAPTIEWLRGNVRWSAALGAVTAAVVGVVANLSVWFAAHVVFASVPVWRGPLGLQVLSPELATVRPAAVVISIGAAVWLLGLHRSLWSTLALSASAGLAATALGWR